MDLDFDAVFVFWPSLHISAGALGISPITVKETVRKLRLAVKMCASRGVPRLRPVEDHA